MAAVRQMSVPQAGLEPDERARSPSRGDERRGSSSPRRSAVVAESTVVVAEPLSKSASQPSSFKVKLTRRDTSNKLVVDSTATKPTTSSSDGEKSKQKLNKAAGWKTSKFFSKTMSSAELLRGLKKLSVNAATTSTSDDPEAKPSASGKVKFTMKKRNSSSDSAVNKDRSPEGLRSGEGSRKSSRESSDGSPNVSPRTSIDEGIVCKKEDILSLIHHNTKKKSSIGSVAIPTAGATSPKKLALRTTRSATIDPSGMATDPYEPTAENIPRIVSTPPAPRRGSTTLERSTSEEAKPSKSKRNSLSAKGAPQRSLEEAPTSPAEEPTGRKTKRKQSGDASTREAKKEAPEDSAKEPAKKDESQVKWDEGNVVDAMLLGDAIEAFLRGSMGGTAAMPATPKRVSFKKT
ncbi:uncharacterized protein LOC144152254 [Haemaphysalis longicornis]|uniref:Uncharacterized protein n=1 Tax=Haemaphysalis longicornis TaxID=44386 RepID=A0A9J6FFN0_HAELO|nr:hypothetical protein HPB48_001387 [Haemaphysalis longicornis]